MDSSAPLPRQYLVQRLKHSLQALALTAHVQIELFPDFVGKAAELALDYSHWHLCVLGNFADEVTYQQAFVLQVLDSRLEEMSGQANSALWTDAALRNRSEWASVRDLAAQALTAFGWEVEVPPSHEHEYVGPL